MSNNSNLFSSEGYDTYLCSYDYDGRRWSVDFPATSFHDAQKRLKAMAKGTVDGYQALRSRHGSTPQSPTHDHG